MKWYFRPAYAYAFATAGNAPIAPAKPKYMDNLMFYGPGPGGPYGGPGGPYGGPGGFGGPGGPFGHGPGGRSVGGRLYHGPYDPGLPGAGYNSLEPKKAGHNKKPNVFVRIRDWWYFHTHEL
jgi:hypothetical protein